MRNLSQLLLVISFPVAAESYRGHSSAVSLPRLIVGIRQCRVPTLHKPEIGCISFGTQMNADGILSAFICDKKNRTTNSAIAYLVLMRFATRLELSPWWNLIRPSSEFLSFNLSQPLPNAGSFSSLPSHVNSNR